MVVTVGIIDHAHSGTTMLAGICEILGVCMVEDQYKPMKWEDTEFIKALQDEQEFVRLVKERNSSHYAWGFKYPGAWMFMDRLQRHLAKPVYMAIYKDPVTVTRRRFGSVTINKLMNTIKQINAGLDGIKATGVPVHILSYHQATVVPLEFVMTVSEIIGAAPTNGQIDAAVGFIQPRYGDPRKKYPSVEEWI